MTTPHMSVAQIRNKFGILAHQRVSRYQWSQPFLGWLRFLAYGRRRGSVRPNHRPTLRDEAYPCFGVSPLGVQHFRNLLCAFFSGVDHVFSIHHVDTFVKLNYPYFHHWVPIRHCGPLRIWQRTEAYCIPGIPLDYIQRPECDASLIPCFLLNRDALGGIA